MLYLNINEVINFLFILNETPFINSLGKNTYINRKELTRKKFTNFYNINLHII